MSIDRIEAAGLPATARPIIERWARVLKTREEDVIATILVVKEHLGGVPGVEDPDPEGTADEWARAAEALALLDDGQFAQRMAAFVVAGLGSEAIEDFIPKRRRYRRWSR